jgi:aryl-alcohol dehydrogenase-like predicted oxidoreductase
MKTRRLGTLEVSEIGAGCMSISANYGPPADSNQGILRKKIEDCRDLRRLLLQNETKHHHE